MKRLLRIQWAVVTSIQVDWTGQRSDLKKKFLQQNVSRCIFLQAIVELYDLGLKKTNIIISSFWNGAHQSQGDDERHREPSMELKTSLNNVHLSYNGEICFLEVTSLQSWGKKANKRIQYNYHYCHYHANTCKSIYVCLKRKQCKTDKTGTSSKWNRLLVSALIYEFHFTPGQCLIFFLTQNRIKRNYITRYKH